MKILRPRSRQELREWLMQNATTEKEALVLCSRKKVSYSTPPFQTSDVYFLVNACAPFRRQNNRQ